MNEPSEPQIKSRGLLIVGLLIAMLFGALDQTIVGTALPRIVGDLGGLGLMAWLTTAYMLTSTVVVPIAGKLADLIGRRIVYVAGLVIFIVASALCGMAQDMTGLIIFRGLQGIGGGIMMPMAMIIIGDLFTGRQRARWMGVFGAVFGLSSVIGPQVGGWIVDSLDWRWVFYINLPVGVLAIILIALALPKHKTKEKVVFDIPGMVTMIVGVVSFLLALTLGGTEFNWLSWQIVGLFALAIASLTAFIQVERRSPEPLLPIHLFSHPVFRMINGLGFLMAVGMFGAIMFVPLFMQGIVGISASESGTVMTPMMLSMILTSVIGGQLVYRIGVKPQISAGMLIMTSGFLMLTNFGLDTSKLYAIACMIVIGLGMGLVMPLLSLTLQEVFPKSEMGVVTSSSQFFRSIGGTFGMTILGTIMNIQSTNQLSSHLEPTLTKLPDQGAMVSGLLDTIQHDPQTLYSLLLSPDYAANMPKALLDLIVPELKNALVISLHDVFWTGLGILAIGVLLTIALPAIRLSDKEKKNDEESEESDAILKELPH